MASIVMAFMFASISDSINVTNIACAAIAAGAPMGLLAVQWFFNSRAMAKQDRTLEWQNTKLNDVAVELKKNSGTSIKDKTDVTADRTAKTLEIVEGLQKSWADQADRIGTIAIDLDLLKERVTAIEAVNRRIAQVETTQASLATQLARLVDHTAMNTLHKSKLLEQERELLAKPELHSEMEEPT